MNKEYNVNEIIELILGRYHDFEENSNLSMGNRNIDGNIVYSYLVAQDGLDLDKFYVHSSIENIDNHEINIRKIEIEGKIDLIIMSENFDISKDVRMNWLYNYMENIDAKRGIVISGYEWNMIDRDGKEYSLNFKNDIDKKDFERFLL